MPTAAKRPCSWPGCNTLVDSGRCDKHKRQERRSYDEYRGSASSRGYGWKWQKYRKRFLAAHPLCAICEANGRVTPATEVDHIEPHKGDQVKFWQGSNHQALCKPCHSRKTATEDGRWGVREKGE
jgi:5-methylcytosine-specific restriction protein A